LAFAGTLNLLTHFTNHFITCHCIYHSSHLHVRQLLLLLLLSIKILQSCEQLLSDDDISIQRQQLVGEFMVILTPTSSTQCICDSVLLTSQADTPPVNYKFPIYESPRTELKLMRLQAVCCAYELTVGTFRNYSVEFCYFNINMSNHSIANVKLLIVLLLMTTGIPHVHSASLTLDDRERVVGSENSVRCGLWTCDLRSHYCDPIINGCARCDDDCHPARIHGNKAAEDECRRNCAGQ